MRSHIFHWVGMLGFLILLMALAYFSKPLSAYMIFFFAILITLIYLSRLFIIHLKIVRFTNVGSGVHLNNPADFEPIMYFVFFLIFLLICTYAITDVLFGRYSPYLNQLLAKTWINIPLQLYTAAGLIHNLWLLTFIK